MSDGGGIFDRETDRRGLLTGAWRKPKAPLPIRPPGAVGQALFEARCNGCGDCAEVCPADAIQMTGPKTGLAEHTPQILAAESACVMCDGLVCSRSCPAGALQPAAPETMRIALVKKKTSACWAAAGIDPGCDHCYQRCPLKGTAITWRMGRGPTIESEHCTGCGSCVWACTAQPKALSITAA